MTAGSLTSARAIATRAAGRRELARVMRLAIGEPDRARRARAERGARARCAGVEQRQLDVLERGRRGQQVELLEDEPDAGVPDAREVVRESPPTCSPSST
jgi:hypothetical protein